MTAPQHTSRKEPVFCYGLRIPWDTGFRNFGTSSMEARGDMEFVCLWTSPSYTNDEKELAWCLRCWAGQKPHQPWNALQLDGFLVFVQVKQKAGEHGGQQPSMPKHGHGYKIQMSKEGIWYKKKLGSFWDQMSSDVLVSQDLVLIWKLQE